MKMYISFVSIRMETEIENISNANTVFNTNWFDGSFLGWFQEFVEHTSWNAIRERFSGPPPTPSLSFVYKLWIPCRLCCTELTSLENKAKGFSITLHSRNHFVYCFAWWTVWHFIRNLCYFMTKPAELLNSVCKH